MALRLLTFIEVESTLKNNDNGQNNDDKDSNNY